MRKRARALLATSVAGLCLAATMAIPAEAAYPYLELCNSSNSRGPIMVYSSRHPSGSRLNTGSCNLYNDSDRSVRVDPDPEIGADVDSFRWGYQGIGLDYCVNGEGTWDPPTWWDSYIKINTNGSYC